MVAHNDERPPQQAGAPLSLDDRWALLRPWTPLFFVACFLLLAFAKTPDLFLNPRFWAEEGRDFFPALRDGSLLNDLMYITKGSYQVLTNLAVFIATRVPLEYAPAVTTYIALLLHTIVAFQIGLSVRALQIPIAAGLMMIVAWAFLPQTYEVWLTATNIQWVTGVSVLLLFFLPGPVIERHTRLAIVWALICGFSGVPATITAPVFFARAILQRSRPLTYVSVALFLCAAIQLAVIATHGTPEREYLADPVVLTAPFVLQSILAPLFSAEFATGVGQAIKIYWPSIGAVFIGTMASGGVILALLLRISRDEAKDGLSRYVLAMWILVTLVQTFGSLNAPVLLSGWAGGRYFLFGSMCMCILLALASRSDVAFDRRWGLGLLLVICIVGVSQRYTSPWVELLVSGPSWRDQLRSCDPVEGCRITIWPGSGWSIDVRPHDLTIRKK